MKKPSLIYVSALLLLLVAVDATVMAQAPAAAPAAQQRGRGQNRGQGQRRPPEVRAEARTRWLTKLLTLTPDQVEKVKQANLTAAQKHDELVASATTGKDRNQQRRQINQDREQQINAVLTDAQKAAWQQFKDEAKRRAEARKAARKAGKAATKANAGSAAPAENDDPDTESNDHEGDGN